MSQKALCPHGKPRVINRSVLRFSSILLFSSCSPKLLGKAAVVSKVFQEEKDYSQMADLYPHRGWICLPELSPNPTGFLVVFFLNVAYLKSTQNFWWYTENDWVQLIYMLLLLIFISIHKDILIFNFLAMPRGMWDLSFSTRDQTHTLLHWKWRFITTGTSGSLKFVFLYETISSTSFSLRFSPISCPLANAEAKL